MSLDKMRIQSKESNLERGLGTLTDKTLLKKESGGETAPPVRRVVPLSTYRLQLHAGFTFDDAAQIADYLQALGITHVYASPYLQAAPGSMHGYDVVDPTRVNEELGGDDAHLRFCQRLGDVGLGQVLDIVPNHMAIGPRNRYWWDVLENGQSSRYASWFDIDWHPAEVKLQNKVLIPVLGDQYGRILSARKIRLEHDRASLCVRYEDQQLPLAPESLSIVLAKAAKYAQNDTLNFIADSFSRLPVSTDPGASMARHRDKTVIYQLLKGLCEEQNDVGNAVAKAIDELNNDIDALDDVLNQQHYRLAYWRTADQELGYRRFFDVNTLVGLRMGREHVFEATHCKVLQWLEDGVLDGVRVDHVDGLRDPLQYFERLRQRAPGAWIIGEKILESGEFLREDWPIDGTSGYDFMNVCNLLLVPQDGMQRLTEIYGDFTNEPVDFAAVAHDKKQNVLHEGLGSDVNRLANLFVEICEKNRDRRDYTRAEIRRSLREVAACFPIYRTYVVPDQRKITEEDRACIDQAVNEAKTRRTDLEASLFDFIGDVLSLRVSGELESEFLMRFQQFTSPVMAKGVEDTAFYCFNRMIGLNEVGNDPGLNGFTLEEFHAYCTKMQATHPNTMTTLSTHDTKRSDDVRARLAAIAEIPDQWKAALCRFSCGNAHLRKGNFPDRNTEYFLYQTMIGAWPIDKDRLIPYMEKAMREAKQQTSWTQNNKEFEDALNAFIEQILQSPEFIANLEDFVGRVLPAGRVNSLAQTLLKFTAPGVPDTYQGSEIWDLSLVDPDNRRPVDYESRRQMLSELHNGISVDEIMRKSDTGMPKLWLVHKALSLRKQHPEWFGDSAEYTPLLGQGPKSEHLISYLRGDQVVAVAPRWPLRLANEWDGTMIDLPSGRWKNVLTGDAVEEGPSSVASLLERFPVALLTRELN
jgi:(1->4)-alpha-D-glucan 1-alpha-D-glucosylmutase